MKLHTLTTHNREWGTRIYIYLNWRFGFSLYSVFFDSYIVSKSYCVKQTTNRESDEWNPQSNIPQQIQNKRWDLRIAFEYSSAIYCSVVSFFILCVFKLYGSDNVIGYRKECKFNLNYRVFYSKCYTDEWVKCLELLWETKWAQNVGKIPGNNEK